MLDNRGSYMKPREYYLGRPFADRANYPYGIERSGDFSVRECQVLNQCGSLYQALLKGEVVNPSEDDFHMMDVMAGAQPAAALTEKVWMKYLEKTEKMKTVPSMLVSYGKNAGEDLDFSADSSFDTEDDF